MFLEINVALPTLKALDSFWKSKDRDKTFLPCELERLRCTVDICCLIMNELEIHVVSTPQHGIDSVAVSVCGLGEGDSPCRKLVVDVMPSCAPSTSTVTPGTSMQKDEAQLRMEEDLADDSLDEDIDEEIDVFPKHLPPIFPSGSRPETPVTISTGTGTSPPIPIPLNIPLSTLGGPPGSGSLVGTPTHFSYMQRLASPDNVSPLSSGYGSAPRVFFASTSTQTPPLSPVLLDLRLRLFNSPTSSSSPPEEQGRCRGRLTQESRGRGRFFSEGHDSSDPTPGSEPGNSANAEPLPDVVTFRRDRANSAPSRPVPPEIMAGRELRRIGDEFVSLFEDQRSLRRTAPNRRSFIRRFLDSLSEMTTPETAHGRPSGVRDGSSV